MTSKLDFSDKQHILHGNSDFIGDCLQRVHSRTLLCVERGRQFSRQVRHSMLAGGTNHHPHVGSDA
ncbi:hypothetical protein [Streptosporangium sp. NPDC000509]|uniref:hypothetical protein n=1 Tax=Streptosporangium sp. NPDC000509 TaxID=3366186 RepID=UPI003686C067